MYIPGELFSSVRQQAPMPSPTPGSVKNKKYKEKYCYSAQIVITQDTQVFVFPHPIWEQDSCIVSRLALGAVSQEAKTNSGNQDWNIWSWLFSEIHH